MTHKKTLVVVLAFLLLAAFIAANAIARPWLHARSLEHADVARDVSRALDRGDLRLLAIEGVAIYLPGTDSALYDAATSGRCRFRIIYAGDAFNSDLAKRVADASFQYAASYNRNLVARVGMGRLCTIAR
jgi:hypothetical protein